MKFPRRPTAANQEEDLLSHEDSDLVRNLQAAYSGGSIPDDLISKVDSAVRANDLGTRSSVGRGRRPRWPALQVLVPACLLLLAVTGFGFAFVVGAIGPRGGHTASNAYGHRSLPAASAVDHLSPVSAKAAFIGPREIRVTYGLQSSAVLGTMRGPVQVRHRPQPGASSPSSPALSPSRFDYPLVAPRVYWRGRRLPRIACPLLSRSLGELPGRLSLCFRLGRKAPPSLRVRIWMQTYEVRALNGGRFSGMYGVSSGKVAHPGRSLRSDCTTGMRKHCMKIKVPVLVSK